MSNPQDGPDAGGRSLSPRLLAIGALLLVVLVAGIVLATRGGDDDKSPSSGSTASSGASGSASASGGSATPSSGSSGSASPSGSATEDGSSTGPALSTRKPLRASFDQKVKPAGSLVVDIAQVEKVQAKAELPGEVSGPALRITVRVANTSDKTVKISTALANLYYGADRTPALPMTRPGSKAFPSEVGAGDEVTGVVLFTVPQDERGNVDLEVIIDANMRRIEFSGDCSGQC